MRLASSNSEACTRTIAYIENSALNAAFTKSASPLLQTSTLSCQPIQPDCRIKTQTKRLANRDSRIWSAFGRCRSVLILKALWEAAEDRIATRVADENEISLDRSLLAAVFSDSAALCTIWPVSLAVSLGVLANSQLIRSANTTSSRRQHLRVSTTACLFSLSHCWHISVHSLTVLLHSRILTRKSYHAGFPVHPLCARTMNSSLR